MNKEVLNLFKIFSSAHDCWILELGKRMSLFKKRSAINWFFTSVYKIKCFQLGPPLIQNIANRYSSKCCLHAWQNVQHALSLWDRTGKGGCHIFPVHAEEGICPPPPGCMRNPLSPRSQIGCVLCISTGQSLILAMYVPWAYAVVQPKSVLPWQPCVTWCRTCYISKSLYIAFATKHTLQYVIWTLVYIARLWMGSKYYLVWNRCLKPRQM